MVNEQDWREEISFVDEAFPDVLGLIELEDSIAGTLSQPFQIALEEELAGRLFPDQSFLGATLIIRNSDGDERDFEVTA